MKYLVVIIVVLATLWVLRAQRRSDRHSGNPEAAPGQHRKPGQAPQDMVSCAVCGLHVPRDEAAAGAQGIYCGAAHLRQAEG